MLKLRLSDRQYAVIWFLLISFTLCGQVTFTDIPLDKQLVARDITTNLGHVAIAGEVNPIGNPIYTSIKIEVYKNDETSADNTYSSALDANSKFDFNIPINAELSNYSFRVYGILGTAETEIVLPEGTGNDVVAGDVYVIQGQSNAVADKRDDTSASEAQNDFIRVYSSGYEYLANVIANDKWYVADVDRGIGNSVNGNSGQWGAKLADLIIDQQGIPIAIFNGARGGKVINYFLENYGGSLENDSDSNNYQRLKYRLDKTGLAGSVRAIFWSQGENISNTVDLYKSNFMSIKNSWMGSGGDYPNVEKIYIFQTINACNSYNVNYQKLLYTKEAQRQLAEENDDIQIMNTDGLVQSSDDCHFIYEGGYKGFAERIYPLVLKDFYDGPANINQYISPNITAAYLTDDITLVVETDASSLSISNASETIKNFALKNANSAVITNVSVSGGDIIFTLSNYPGSNATISNEGALPGVQNYLIKNGSTGPEILSFDEYPISDSLITIWTRNSWNNGNPTQGINAIVDDEFNPTAAQISDLITNNLKINAGFTLEFDGNSTKSITVSGNLTIDGTMTLGDTESLITLGNVSGNGTFNKIEKTTNLKSQYDVTYFSSPVENASLSATFSGVDAARIFHYDPINANPAYINAYEKYRHWFVADGSMIPGKGYSVDGRTTPPNGESYPNYEMQVVFTGGKPNHGDISVPISKYSSGNEDYDKANLLGNPYPTAIDADLLIVENTVTNNVFQGTIYLWDHSEDYVTGHYTADYLTYNLAGSVPGGSGSYSIASGQGFMILTNELSANFNFKSSMQVEGQNNQFYKGTKKKSATKNKEDKVWLHLSHEDIKKKEVLLAFSKDAGSGFDKGYDGKLLNIDAPITFYSLIEDDKYAIQSLGKNLSRTSVKLGFSSNQGGTFKIGISKLQGFAKNQKILLKDKKKHSIHDLIKSDYEFFINEAGDFSDRFSIRFVGGNKTDERNASKNILKVTNISNGFRFKSVMLIEELTLYDMFGRIIYHAFPKQGSFNIELNKIKKGTIVVIQAKMDNGRMQSLKMIKQ